MSLTPDTAETGGTPANASAIVAVVQAPDGSESTLTLAGGDVVQVVDSDAVAVVGSYYITVRATLPTDARTRLGYTAMVTATVGGLQRKERAAWSVLKDPT